MPISGILCTKRKPQKGVNNVKETPKEFIKKHRIDIIVIASLLLLSLLVLLIAQLTRKDGAVAIVTVNGETVGEYPMDLDAVYTINGGTNILTVEGGIAYMSYSDCPDHVCERTGKVRYVGEQIVCLPNKVTVTVSGEIPGDSGVDFVS